MDYFFQLLNSESNSQNTIEIPNEVSEETLNDIPTRTMYGFAIPISALILNSSPFETAIRGDLNGTDFFDDIDTLDNNVNHLFAINIQPNNIELLKRIHQTILMYRKDKLVEMTQPDKIECCICFTDKDYSVKLKCEHKFCLDCMIKIVFESKRNSCPLCRDIFIN